MRFDNKLSLVPPLAALLTAAPASGGSLGSPHSRDAAAAIHQSSSSIPASSSAGARLLSKSRRLNGENEEDVGWMVDYSLKFESCHEIAAVGGEAGGGGEREGEGQAGLQRLIKFRLCPTDACSSGCRGGAEYVADIREFVEAYLDAKEEMEERQNENNGNNNNQNNNQNNQQDFDIERFLECEPLNEGQGGGNNANYGNYDYYYTGAYCGSGGKGVYLGVFSDAACSVRADSKIFEKYYYSGLPYSTTSLVSSDCLSCDANKYENDGNNYNYDYNNDNNDGNNNQNNQNNNNQDNEDRVLDLCEELHERSAKCESNLNIKTYNANSYSGYRYYPHTESCQFIHSTLSSLESVSKTNGRSLKTARAFAWIFGISTVALVGYIIWDKSFKNNDRRSIDLSTQGYGSSAGGLS